MATGTLWISRSTHPWWNFSLAETNPKEALFLGDCNSTWALLGSSTVSATREGAAEPPPHPASVTRTSWHPLHAPAQAPQEASPSIPRLPWAKSRFLHPEVFPFFPWDRSPSAPGQKCPQPFPRPQQLQLLSQAWLGMEMCSWHRNSSPEPAFGYQPWVWFEILPQENVHPLAEPFSLRPWGKSPAITPPLSVLQFQCTPSRRSTSSSSLAPQQTTLAPNSP